MNAYSAHASARSLAGFFLPCLLVSLSPCLLVSPCLAAQNQTKKPPVEEEEQVKPAKPKVPVKVEEDEPDPKRKTDPSEAPRLPELAFEAEHATVPAIRNLFRELAVPYDLVTWKSQRQTHVAPVSDYVGATPNPAAAVNLRIYDEKGRRGSMSQTSLKEIERIDHYEDISLRSVQLFLAKATGEGERPLALLEKTLVAEKVLAAVLRFHESAREAGQREGTAWAGLRDALKKKLLDVQLERLRALSDPGEWQQAFDLASRLARLYPDREVQDQLAKSLGAMVNQSMKRQRYEEARFRLRLLEEQFPSAPAMSQISAGLRARAQELLDQAKEREKSSEREAAMTLTRTAESIWPGLPGLQDYGLHLRNALPPTLEVGVRDLPEKLSPAAAVTDAERQAVELLFESLVKPVADEHNGETYEPMLGNPRVTPLARRFQLRKDAWWSDNTRVTAGDVQYTAKLMGQPGWAGYAPEWGELLEAEPARDPYQISLKLHQGLLEPLSWMTFKVLPRDKAADQPKFAEHPVGSGPFQYQGRDTDTNAAIFAANPYYHRAGKPGEPQIRKIRFFHSPNPVEDFQAGRLHVLLDLPTAVTQPLKSLDYVKVLTQRNRRIYFLAVNHRVPPLEKPDVRKAIARAINREQILNDVFRGYLANTPDAPHRALNGPYPPGTWAYKADNLPADPHNSAIAKMLADKLNGKKLSLRLKYPNDDDLVRRACEAIRTQVNEQVHIELQLEPRSPDQLRQDVEVAHDYELAYYHFDYSSDMFWLWPLFNPRGISQGGNYLGYGNDSELESAFQEAMGHREFAKVRQLTHRIHEIIFNKMPFIPLWQLDTHIAIHKDVDYGQMPLDPLRVFADVEKWKLERK